jgi:magnesium-transporting ATPase (P-type)
VAGEDLVEGAPYLGFKEATLSKMIQDGDESIRAFWRLLAVCHTIQPEEIDGKIEYQAQSPDEKALTEAARYALNVFCASSDDWQRYELCISVSHTGASDDQREWHTRGLRAAQHHRVQQHPQAYVGMSQNSCSL